VAVASDASRAMIVLDTVTKRFADTAEAAVESLSMDVPRGELVVLVGPSGCGKTTTLKMVNRLVEPTSGRIFVDGTDVLARPAPELRRDIGYVIQQVGLFPHRTVGENIATVPRLLGWPRVRIGERVRELLDLMELDRDLLDRYPRALSGGQQQRVGVARALAADPPVLLMDEPYGAVDPLVRRRLQEHLRSLQDQLRKTILFVTHDIDEAVALGDRIAVLGPGGRLEQYATPDTVLASPSSPFVASFLGDEPTLKRLSLHRVSDLDLDGAPIVDVGTSALRAQQVAAGAGTDWVAVRDRGRIAGWIPTGTLAGPVEPAQARAFGVELDVDTNLRAAVDVLLGTRPHAGVVRRDGRDIGVVRLDALLDGLSR
jgi:osmoprotectant transport system ATP-binding protein